MAPSSKALAVAALCGLSAAFPQGVDFAAIAAAPDVTDGPTGVAPSQTASLFTSFTVNTVANAPSNAPAKKARGWAAPYTYSGRQTSSANGAGVGQSGASVNVQAGASVWLNGKGNHNIFGNLANWGSVYFSQSAYIKGSFNAPGLTSNWTGSDAYNGNLVNYPGGLIQFNDIEASASASFNWDLNSFSNNGTIQWCARGDFGGSIFGLSCGADIVNSGLISFEQFKGNAGGSFSWSTDVSAAGSWYSSWNGQKVPNIYHNGAFRLINTVFRNKQNVFGSGCWSIGIGATLYLESGTGITCNPSAAPALSGQSIIFADASAVLHLDAGVYSINSQFGAQIYGFGQGHAIEFGSSVQYWYYDSIAGTLAITFTKTWAGQPKCILKIGKGYIVGKFRLTVKKSIYGSYWAIYYDAPCPTLQPTPSQCSITVPTCTPLGPGSSSTSAPVTTSSVATTTSTSAPVTTTSSSSSSTSTSTVASTTSVSSTSTTPVITSTTDASSCVPTIPTLPPSSYSPYYPALTTGYTTNPALTGTTTSGQACPTQVEAGTYCGFINPNDPCAPQPDGYGPVPTPDTDSAFLAYPTFHSLARAAPTQVASPRCGTYNQVFVDLNSSVSADSYLGLYTLQSYDVPGCALRCDANRLCTSFNIYIERDPTVKPSTEKNQDPTVWGNVCPNPGSMTTFKCTLYGSSIDASVATNYGGYREKFHVVKTGSNGYDRTNDSIPIDPTSPVSSSTVISTSLTTDVASSSSTDASTTTSSTSVPVSVTSTTASVTPTSKPGKPCKPPKPCKGGKAIDAPAWWMGSRFFPGPFNPQVCSDFALAQNALNSLKGSASKCKMFNAYYLHKNGAPHGTYCSLYSAVLNSTWATWSGGVSGGISFTSQQSWLFELNL